MDLKFIKVLFLGIAALLLGHSCVMESENETSQKKFEQRSVNIDLPEILSEGKLKILFENSSSSYFEYREKKMGFEYELLKLFADELGVQLEPIIVNDLDSLIPMLNSGKGDLIACNYTITQSRKKTISFSDPFMETYQVLVQRKPDGWKKMSKKQLNASLLQNPSDLAGKKVNVWKSSSYHQRLKSLQDEIGETIDIQGEDGDISGEELIELVSEGVIDYTVIEDNVAKINKQFYPNISADLRLSVADQKMAFGIRKSSHLLKAKLNDWLEKFKKTPTYGYIERKYFTSKPISLRNMSSKNIVLSSTAISKFDDYFRKAGNTHGWDWRLIASVSYQESKFNPEIQSFGGAYGMMQFMPNTGPTYGVYPDSPPEVQIMGGAKKLATDEKYWSKIPDPLQRKKFALASYNCGRGHVLDAQRLAKKHGLDANKWDDNVEEMILNLRKKEYYQDEVVRHGRMRSKITYKYVREVMERYLEWVGKYR